MSRVFVQATRALHRAAVGLHLAGLRSTVSAANSRSAKAEAAADRADAVVGEAIKARAAARYNKGHAIAEAQAVEYAARQEAVNIGGKL